MSFFRPRLFLPAFLALALFLGWLGVGAAHHHVDQPGCEICKAMHHDAADLPRPAGVPAPRLNRDAIAAASLDHAADRDLLLQRGRAPPRS